GSPGQKNPASPILPFTAMSNGHPRETWICPDTQEYGRGCVRSKDCPASSLFRKPARGSKPETATPSRFAHFFNQEHHHAFRHAASRPHRHPRHRSCQGGSLLCQVGLH